jgi:hypothetical protein
MTKGRVLNIFNLQESVLLLKGQDATERLRQLHDQINVLRGAAFDAVLAFSLFLFGWCAQFPPKLRWGLVLVPVGYLVFGLLALRNHFEEHGLERTLSNPPFMEFTLLVLGAAGCYLLYRGAPVLVVQGERVMPKERNVHTNPRAGLLLLLWLFTATAFLAWWMTEALYDKQVIYSYYADSQR